MKHYYFTFGQSHWHRDGIPMANFWVLVTAESFGKDREIFVNDFTTPFMQSPEKFAFQYEEKDFNSHFFPGGEFAHIKQS